MTTDINIFKSMSDSDFFSNKLTHIYFNEIVSNKSIIKLIEKIENANKEVKTESGAILNPKPILIHISSKGGSLDEGMALLSVFEFNKVPIATIIDNYACSAATFLAINSPYRLINNFGFCLIHEYNVKFSGETSITYKKRELHNYLSEYDIQYDNIINMYERRTKMKRSEIVEMVQHDLLLNANFCLKNGIVDRVINIEKKNKKNLDIKKDIYEIIKNPYNNIKISCNNSIEDLDKILFQDNLTPVILYPRNSHCDNDEKTDNKRIQDNIFDTLNIIPRILRLKQPIYAIINSPISIDDLLPMLYCDHIFIFDYAHVINNILYFHNKNSLLIDDNIKNTELIFNIITQILKEKTKMDDKTINDIKNKFSLFDADKCLKLGLCHSIIHQKNKLSNSNRSSRLNHS
jgi:ATP-dependent protease ClpP protease subunit